MITYSRPWIGKNTNYQCCENLFAGQNSQHTSLLWNWQPFLSKKVYIVCVRSLFLFQDLFNIGEITVETGNAFGCADPELWYNNPQPSRSGLSIEKNTIKYDYLVNTDGKNKAAVWRFLFGDFLRLTFMVIFVNYFCLQNLFF